MSIESVKAFFAANAPDVTVLEYGASTATVALAAAAQRLSAAVQLLSELCDNARPVWHELRIK